MAYEIERATPCRVVLTATVDGRRGARGTRARGGRRSYAPRRIDGFRKGKAPRGAGRAALRRARSATDLEEHLTRRAWDRGAARGEAPRRPGRSRSASRTGWTDGELPRHGRVRRLPRGRAARVSTVSRRRRSSSSRPTRTSTGAMRRAARAPGGLGAGGRGGRGRGHAGRGRGARRVPGRRRRAVPRGALAVPDRARRGLPRDRGGGDRARASATR